MMKACHSITTEEVNDTVGALGGFVAKLVTLTLIVPLMGDRRRKEEAGSMVNVKQKGYDCDRVHADIKFIHTVFALQFSHAHSNQCA